MYISVHYRNHIWSIYPTTAIIRWTNVTDALGTRLCCSNLFWPVDLATNFMGPRKQGLNRFTLKAAPRDTNRRKQPKSLKNKLRDVQRLLKKASQSKPASYLDTCCTCFVSTSAVSRLVSAWAENCKIFKVQYSRTSENKFQYLFQADKLVFF